MAFFGLPGEKNGIRVDNSSFFYYRLEIVNNGLINLYNQTPLCTFTQCTSDLEGLQDIGRLNNKLQLQVCAGICDELTCF
jgi:hypothetical protein